MGCKGSEGAGDWSTELGGWAVFTERKEARRWETGDWGDPTHARGAQREECAIVAG